MRLQSGRSEAPIRNSRSGKLRSSSNARNSRPTAPVAPRIATTGGLLGSRTVGFLARSLRPASPGVRAVFGAVANASAAEADGVRQRGEHDGEAFDGAR